MDTQNKPFQHRMAELLARRDQATPKRSRLLYEKKADGQLEPVVLRQGRRVPWAGLELGSAASAMGASKQRRVPMYSQNKPFQAHMAELVSRRREAHQKRVKILYDKRPDGLLVPVVIHEARRVPWAGLAFVFIGLIAIKGFLFAYFGAEAMEVRVTDLSQGAWYNQVYAFLLQPDVLTGQLAQWISVLLPGLKY